MAYIAARVGSGLNSCDQSIDRLGRKKQLCYSALAQNYLTMSKNVKIEQVQCNFVCDLSA